MARLFDPSDGVHKGWSCRCSDCPYAVNDKLNYADRVLCNGCGRAKAKARSPPPALAIEASPPKPLPRKGVPGLGPTARSEQRRRKREGGQTTTAAPTTQPQTTKAPAEPQPGLAAALKLAQAAPTVGPGKPLVLSQELLGELGDLAQALQPVVASLAGERLPTQPDPKNTEAEVSKLLAEQRPCAAAGQVAALEAQVGQLKASLAVVAGFPAAEEPLTKLLDDAVAKLAKLAKTAPSVESEVIGLERAASAHALALQERADRHAGGAKKGQDRAAVRAKVFSDLRALLAKAELEVTELEAKLAHEHAAADRARAQIDQEIASALDAKIKLAKAEATKNEAEKQAQAAAARRPPAPGPLAAPPGPGTALALTAVPTAAAADSSDELAALRLSNASIQEQLRQLQAALLQSQARDQAGDLFDAIVPEVSLDALPTLTAGALSEPELRVCGMVWWLLSRWAGAGASSPFTLEEAAQELQVPVDGVVAAFKAALGEKHALWDVSAQAFVTRQCCNLVHMSLARLKETYEQAKEAPGAEKQARVAFDAIDELAKKRRRGH